jgi:hypothetical protein
VAVSLAWDLEASVILLILIYLSVTSVCRGVFAASLYLAPYSYSSSVILGLSMSRLGGSLSMLIVTVEFSCRMTFPSDCESLLLGCLLLTSNRALMGVSPVAAALRSMYSGLLLWFKER